MKKIIGNSYKLFLVWLCLIISVGITGCDTQSFSSNEKELDQIKAVQAASTKKKTTFTIPKYSGKPYAVINKNVPSFKKTELKKTSYET